MRTELTLSKLVDRLQTNCGDILDACRAAGVSLVFVRQWRKDDAKVNERLTEAENVGTMGLVSAAIQRGVHGVNKGVYFKGVRVDEEKVYSDGLLQTLLKAKIPEFSKDGEGGSGTSVTVNIANVMPRADSYEQWLEMKRSTLPPALPAPAEQIEDAEYENVLETVSIPDKLPDVL